MFDSLIGLALVECAVVADEELPLLSCRDRVKAMRGRARCRTKMIGSSRPERCSARIVSSDFAVRTEGAKRIADGD